MQLPYFTVLLVGMSFLGTQECYDTENTTIASSTYTVPTVTVPSTTPVYVARNQNLLVVDLTTQPTVKSLTINWAITSVPSVMAGPQPSFRSTPLTSTEIGLGPDTDGTWNLILYLHELIDGNLYTSVYLERQQSTKGKCHVTVSLQAKFDNGTVLNSVGPETTIFPDGEADNTNYGWANFVKESSVDKAPSSNLNLKAHISFTCPVTTTRHTQRQPKESDSEPFLAVTSASSYGSAKQFPTTEAPEAEESTTEAPEAEESTTEAPPAEESNE